MISIVPRNCYTWSRHPTAISSNNILFIKDAVATSIVIKFPYVLELITNSRIYTRIDPAHELGKNTELLNSIVFKGTAWGCISQSPKLVGKLGGGRDDIENVFFIGEIDVPFGSGHQLFS